MKPHARPTTASQPAPSAPVLPLAPASVPWDARHQGQCVVSMTADTRGALWVGTEDQGVWRYNPAAQGKPWTQFTAKDGLADDDAYALCCDLRGRVWAGSGTGGVSVYNGKAWKTYGVLDGPLGAHVTALAVCPTDGAVWGATEAGVFRYAHDAWTYYTRAEGLPSDQANGIAFDQSGNVYVTTPCSGLAIGAAAGGYKTWRQVPGPDTPGNTSGGIGLPSNLTNCVLICKNGDIYVGTDAGLAHSGDGGQTWLYTRGADYADKCRGLLHPVVPVPAGAVGDVLLEDYVTCLAQDAAGRIVVGHRQMGVEVLDPQTLKRVSPTGQDKPAADYAFCLLPSLGGAALVGRYGGGLSALPTAGGTGGQEIAVAVPASVAPFPTPAKAPSAASLQAMLRQVKAVTGDLPQGGAAYVGEDWVTRGDWVGHYGRQYARLCAMDHVLTCTSAYSTESVVGPHHARSDGLRWWVTKMQTDDPRALYTPVKGVRREADWDDHGEGYKRTFDGPDIWVRVTLREGDLHRVSLYFVNKDGQTGNNRLRDYTVEVKPQASDAAPTLARARVQNFWGGVYKSFVVRTPGTYFIKISKNSSLNTTLAAVLIDKLQGVQMVTDQEPMAYMNDVRYDPPALPLTADATAPPKGETAAQALWSALDGVEDKAQGLPLQWPYRLLALRAAAQGAAPEPLLANWRWSLGLWTPEERRRFTDVMAQAWQERLRNSLRFVPVTMRSVRLSAR